MNITVVGLGLIGGSICKTIKKHTAHKVYGYDINENVLRKALKTGAINKAISIDEMVLSDMVIVALHPVQTIKFLLDHTSSFKKGAIIMDTGGVKKEIVEALEAPLAKRGLHFVAAHPMAGREFSGFDYALDDLFDNASFIVTPTENTDKTALEAVEKLAVEMKFGKVICSTPDEHDKVIAFTSQLAHVVSSAYIKSPTLENEVGFSAGSFLDLTRVAKLNEDMWVDLFLMNRENLLFEIDEILRHLEEYRTVLAESKKEKLTLLLREGRLAKERNDHAKEEEL